MNLYFVGGIHGTGKSTLCASLAALLPAEHLSAGQLARGPAVAHTIDKRVSDVAGNQRRLLEALAVRRNSTEDLLLDGHYCVLNASRSIERLPLEVFADIKPSALLLVSGPSGEISRRLSERDNAAYDVAFIEDFARAEHEHASAISRELALPLLTVNWPASVSQVADLLRRI